MFHNTKLKKSFFSITIDTASPSQSKNIWKITGIYFAQDKECLICSFTSFWCTSCKSCLEEDEILILTSEKWIKVWGKCETVNHVFAWFCSDCGSLTFEFKQNIFMQKCCKNGLGKEKYFFIVLLSFLVRLPLGFNYLLQIR